MGDPAAHTGAVNALQFVEHRNYLASASEDRSIRVWDITNYSLVSIHMCLSVLIDIKRGRYFVQIQGASGIL